MVFSVLHYVSAVTVVALCVVAPVPPDCSNTRYVMTFFSALLLVLILFFRKKIAIAIGIIKEASSMCLLACPP